MKKPANVHGRLRRVERDRGIDSDAREPVWAALLARGSASRRQALEWFWNFERDEALRRGSAPDPQRPILIMKLLDGLYPSKIVQRHLELHEHSSMAYRFVELGFSREEVAIVAMALDPLLPRPRPDQETAVLSVASKIDDLFSRAEAIQAEDIALMALIVNGPEVGGGGT
jgi:hypothetical protein